MRRLQARGACEPTTGGFVEDCVKGCVPPSLTKLAAPFYCASDPPAVHQLWGACHSLTNMPPRGCQRQDSHDMRVTGTDAAVCDLNAAAVVSIAAIATAVVAAAAAVEMPSKCLPVSNAFRMPHITPVRMPNAFLSHS